MQQRLNVRYRITWEGGWHVGSGFRTTATDRLIQRIGGTSGQPFVPGSQIKGVLRHTCERLAQALGLKFVDPHATSGEQQRLLVKHFGPLRTNRLLVDRLFGTRFQGDCLFVDNATAEPPDAPHGPCKGHSASEQTKPNRTPATLVRTRTAMDRVTRTVKERHLFTTEIADQGITLVGRIRARHPAGVLTQYDNGFPYEYALLLVGLMSIDRLGGDKSSGLGRCRVEIEQVLWNGSQMDIDECLSPLEDIAEFEPDELVQWLQDVRAEG